MNREEIELAIRQNKMARETWYHTRGQAEVMIARFTQALTELEGQLADMSVDKDVGGKSTID